MFNRRELTKVMAVAAATVTGVSAMSSARAEELGAVSEESTWDAIQRRGVLRVGGPLGEPYYYRDILSGKSGDDQWVGMGPALGRIIADALGVKFQMIETSWGTAPAGLQNDQFDVVFALDATPQRALVIDFLPTQWFWYSLAVLARDGLKVEQWDALNAPNIKLGVSLGGASDSFATKHLANASISRFNKLDEMIAAFNAGRVDAVITANTGADLFVQRLQRGQSVIPKPTFWFASNCGIRLEKDPRWKNYLTLVAQYLYNSGQVADLYNDFIRSRGLDPTKMNPIIREG